MARFAARALLGSLLILPSLWAVVNWQGRSYLADMRKNMQAKFPDMEQQLKAPESIPDAKNFWKSPHMARFKRLPGTEARQAKNYGTVDVLDMIVDGLKSDRWEKLASLLQSGSGKFALAQIAQTLRCQGLEIPLEENAAREAILGLLTVEESWQALNAAATACPSAEPYPSLKQREQLWAAKVPLSDIPLPRVCGLFETARELGFRTAIAMAINSPEVAIKNMEIVLRMSEGFGQRGGSLVEALYCTATQKLWLEQELTGVAGLPTIIRSGKLTSPELLRLHGQLSAYDEDAMIIDRCLLVEMRVTGVDAEELRTLLDNPMFGDTVPMIASWAPAGLLNSNLAVVADQWTQSLVPNTEADDLITLAKTLPNLVYMCKQHHPFSPTAYLSSVTTPATNGLPECALACQTARRQLLVAIGAHRYRLAHGHFPERQEQMVPQFLPALERDPHAKGKLMNYQRTAEGFEVTSADPEIKFTQPTLH